MPVIELTTMGRRSGERRATMLTSPVRDGNSYVVVASRGGDDHHPAWFLNLRDDPRVEVVIEGRPRTAMLARIADAEQRARLWPLITAKYANYAGYQQKTDREIPLVLLEASPDAGSGDARTAN
jgi:deazaflavin-dependent oxidoreductase (nitroreductase family)